MPWALRMGRELGGGKWSWKRLPDRRNCGEALASRGCLSRAFSGTLGSSEE